MGGIPTRDAPHTFFSLRYGTHEVGLIPLVRRYFTDDNKELRQQFVRMRNDPSIRYHFMRQEGYSMKELPPANYTEEKLNVLLDLIEDTLYDTTAAMLADRDAPLRPVPCAICFVYVNGREGSDCFSFYGRRINIIGYFGCRQNEDKPDDPSYLHFRKAILKAAGDRTLERVITLAATVLKEEYFRAVARTIPGENALELLQRRAAHSTLLITTLWNSYPTLKFLCDTCALACAVEQVRVDEDPPTFDAYERPESGERGMRIRMRGPLLLRLVLWVGGLLNPSAVRGAWEQFVLDDRRAQQKEKLVAQWLERNPKARAFLGDAAFTARVTAHLSNLLREIVRARETPAEDLRVWRPEQACSHDGKLYRVFDSPLCGPFLTTVKPRRPATESAASEESGRRSVSRVLGPPPAATRAPPQYAEAVGATPTPFVSPPLPGGGSHTAPAPSHMPSASPLAPGSMMVVVPAPKAFPDAPQTGVGQTAFVPIFPAAEGTHAVPVKPHNMPYVVLAPPGQTGGGGGFTFFAPTPNLNGGQVGMGGVTLVETVQPPQMPNYVMLPDGRIGLINTTTTPPLAPGCFWT